MAKPPRSKANGANRRHGGRDVRRSRTRAILPIRFKAQGQESLRAEIERDAIALIELDDAHAPLAVRKVDPPRLEKLRGRARALAGKIAARASSKGTRYEGRTQRRQPAEPAAGRLLRRPDAGGASKRGHRDLLREAAKQN